MENGMTKVPCQCQRLLFLACYRFQRRATCILGRGGGGGVGGWRWRMAWLKSHVNVEGCCLLLATDSSKVQSVSQGGEGGGGGGGRWRMVWLKSHVSVEGCCFLLAKDSSNVCTRQFHVPPTETEVADKMYYLTHWHSTDSGACGPSTDPWTPGRVDLWVFESLVWF